MCGEIAAMVSARLRVSASLKLNPGSAAAWVEGAS
jgi:hypothetical protein